MPGFLSLAEAKAAFSPMEMHFDSTIPAILCVSRRSRRGSQVGTEVVANSDIPKPNLLTTSGLKQPACPRVLDTRQGFESQVPCPNREWSERGGGSHTPLHLRYVAQNLMQLERSGPQKE
jgi:hypothetical protein